MGAVGAEAVGAEAVGAEPLGAEAVGAEELAGVLALVGLSAEPAVGLLPVVGLAKAVGGLARVVISDSKQRSVKTCGIDLILSLGTYPIP